MTIRHLSFADSLLSSCQQGVQLLTTTTRASRPNPAGPYEAVEQVRSDGSKSTATTSAQQHAGALMRVNHVGEVCAQALYQGQALMAREPAVAEQFERAAREEQDHLAWTEQRLLELHARRSALTPLWFTASFVIGMLAGRAGDRESLGFMAETERQVEAHLASHLQRLPDDDLRSRAIVAKMKQDEADHAAQANHLGARPMRWPARSAMKLAARVMTTVAHRI